MIFPSDVYIFINAIITLSPPPPKKVRNSPISQLTERLTFFPPAIDSKTVQSSDSRVQLMGREMGG